MRDPRGKLTLDDLLAAKRREEPSCECWDTFDRELRLKQRKLLQNQPCEEIEGLDGRFWPILRRIVAGACVAASCGALAVIYTTSNQLATQTDSHQADHPIARIGPDTSTRASSDPVFFQVEVSEQPFASPHASLQESKLAKLAESKTSPATLTDPGYTLKLDTPIATLDVDSVIAFSVGEEIARKIGETYLNPLASLGYESATSLAAIKFPIDRITQFALRSDLFGSRAESALTLDSLSLRF